MNKPALLTSVSMRPNRWSASSMMRSAVLASAMSPATASTSPSSDGLIVSEFATTAHPSRRYPATTAAPMPREAPVTMTTLACGSAMNGLVGVRRGCACQVVEMGGQRVDLRGLDGAHLVAEMFARSFRSVGYQVAHV